MIGCRGLIKVWYNGERCDIHGLWSVLLKSNKDQFLGADPQENMCHHVPGME
jgi:hypothetical protein